MAEGDSTVEGYAEAIFAVAKAEGGLDRVEDELYRFARAFESNAELGRRLSDEAIDLQTRTAIVQDLLGGKAHQSTVNAVSFVVQSGRARQLPQIADAVVAKASTARRRGVAEVRSAIPLDEDQTRRLAAALEQSSGQQVDVKVVVDPEVVGGLIVRMGDTVIDGTVARRLAEMRTAMTGS
jgi:F-type H+-transporting ATPase subunit delta